MTKNDLRWQSIQTCDTQAAGTFVYGNKADGLYHSPLCRRRPTDRDDVQFFDTPDEARKHGFKACHACSPDRADWLVGASRWM